MIYADPQTQRGTTVVVGIGGGTDDGVMGLGHT